MLKHLSFMAVLLLALTVLGCKSGALAAQRQKLSGKWYAKPAKNSYDPGSGLTGLLFGGGSDTVILELDQEGKFKIDLFGVPMEGEYELGGERITLNIQSIFGESMTSPLGALTGDTGEKMKGKILFDGKNIVFSGRSGWSGYSDLTFTRDAPPEERLGPRSVTAAEASLLGDYVFDASVPMPSSGVTSPIGGEDLMAELYKKSSLTLREDNTFIMYQLLRMKGTWRLNGQTIMLYTSNGGILGSQTMHAQIAKFGKQLLVSDGGMSFALKKKE